MTCVCVHYNYVIMSAMASQIMSPMIVYSTLHWRHNDHDSASNHQPHGCLLNHLFRHRSKKTSKLRVTGLCVGNSLGPVNSLHKGPVTRKMFPFGDVIMIFYSGAYQGKHQRYVSLAFVQGIQRWPVNSPHKGPVTRKMFPFDDVIMFCPFLI